MGGGGDGSVSDCLGGHEDATTKEGMRWSSGFFFSCLISFFLFLEKNIIFIYLKKDTRFAKFGAFLGV